MIEALVVAPEVLLPHLIHQAGVPAKHFLMASCQHLVQGSYLLLVQSQGPLGSCLGCGPT